MTLCSRRGPWRCSSRKKSVEHAEVVNSRQRRRTHHEIIFPRHFSEDSTHSEFERSHLWVRRSSNDDGLELIATFVTVMITIAHLGVVRDKNSRYTKCIQKCILSCWQIYSRSSRTVDKRMQMSVEYSQESQNPHSLLEQWYHVLISKS